MTAAPSRPAPPRTARPWAIRALALRDIDGLMAIQQACYGADFLESAALYARRLACAHQLSLALECSGTQTLQAYAAAYWSNPGKLTPLRGDFDAPASGEHLLYLHDMAVAPGWAGQGAASRLLQALFEKARAQGVRLAALVSVQGSQSFWSRYGFVAQELLDPLQRQRLHSYGGDAVYMVAAL